MSTAIRYVDVQVTEPHFVGDETPARQLAPEIDLAPGESIVAISDSSRSTSFGVFAAWARIWIATTVAPPARDEIR